MATTALHATGHGYESGEYGRCEAFDAFDIIANPLGGNDRESRESRVFRSPLGGNAVTYDSYAVYLLQRKDRRKDDRDYFIAVHHGGGRRIWKIPACKHFCDETVAALLAMPERALYSLLWGMIDALDETKRAAEENTARAWRIATLDKRVKVSRQPAKGRAFVWIEPERKPDESDAQHRLRCAFAKPHGVR